MTPSEQSVAARSGVIEARPSAARAEETTIGDVVLSVTDRTRVFRRSGTHGTMIVKQALGSAGASRARHEVEILEFLADVPGISKTLTDRHGYEFAADSIALRDDRGTPLSTVILGAKLDVGEQLVLASRLAKTLDAIHRLGVVHRDINPGNILLVEGTMEPILIDFHLASRSAEERAAFAPQDKLVGTLAYIAPEQTGRTARPIDERADLYSLGATLYEVATGRTPFGSGDALDVVRDHLLRIPVAPAVEDPTIPPAFSDMIMRLLEKEPDRRYQSAHGFAIDVGRLIDRRASGSDASFPLGERDFPLRLMPPSRLVGRDRELAELRAAFDDAMTGEKNALLVAGAPGVGKTALIDELRTMASADGGFFVTGKFDQYRRDGEGNAVNRAFRDLLALLLAEPEEAIAPLREKIVAALGDRLDVAISRVPEFGALLGAAANPTSLAEDSAAKLAQITVSLLRIIASGLRPVVFVVDDLQWASETALDIFDIAINEDPTPGLLVVGAYRASEVTETHALFGILERSKWADRAPRRLALAELPTNDLATLIAGMLRLSPQRAAELAAVVGARTKGNPYDTVELVNTLRNDGALVPGEHGWTWDATNILTHVGCGNVVDLLSARIAALPPPSARLLETIACIGNDVPIELVAAATGLPAATLERRIAPALADGLVVRTQGSVDSVRFRHDRVQQAAHGRLEPDVRRRIHLEIANRLATVRRYRVVAAEQYHAAIEEIAGDRETERAIALFEHAAAHSSILANYDAAERFATAALSLARRHPTSNETLIAKLEIQLHRALYNLGRLAEADTVFATIDARPEFAVAAVDARALQIDSLIKRNMSRAALDLGLRCLREHGVAYPNPEDLRASILTRSARIARWNADEAGRHADEYRPEPTDCDIVAAAKLLSHIAPAAFLCDHDALAWIEVTSLDLWTDHGPQRALTGAIAHVAFVEDSAYLPAYRATMRILAACEARGYGPETAHARFLFGHSIQQYYEPFEACMTQLRLAYEGLLRGGDLQTASTTFFGTIALLVTNSSTIDEFSLEVDAAISFCIRTGNDQARQSFAPFRQLAKFLRGSMASPTDFGDADFNASSYETTANEHAKGYFAIARALGAAVYGDEPNLVEFAERAMRRVEQFGGGLTPVAYFLHGFGLAVGLRDAPPDARARALREFATCRAWLVRRADDNPEPFLHFVKRIDAERAWAVGDFDAAFEAFEAALRETRIKRSPRHAAHAAERAGLFYIERGLHHCGRVLLAEAREAYAAWGAVGKVRQLDKLHPFLADMLPTRRDRGSSNAMSSEHIDMVAIVRASQALSSQTTIASLEACVGTLLASLTGATSVRLAIARDGGDSWVVSAPGEGDATTTLSIAEAARRGLVPLGAFRYVERTSKPLLVEDAVSDARFSRDPYFSDCERCSLLVVPIVSQGTLRAIVLLENRLGSGAFSASRLDAVTLIAGQLAVSIDNALLYASLERKVAERTDALTELNSKLALLSETDPLTGLANRRSFDDHYAALWSRSLGERRSIALAMIDIDEFKKYNDTYGHPAGDACLRLVAKTLMAGIRPASDLAARYGGEEFLIVLTDTDVAGINAVAERIRASIASLQEPHASSAHGIVTISVGVVAFTPSKKFDPQHYVKAADLALYEAKHAGRNRVAEATEFAETEAGPEAVV